LLQGKIMARINIAPRQRSPPVSVFVGTYGVFLKPIMADMGWDRGTASFALSAGTFFSAFAFPVFGRLMDRRTIRAVALPAIVAYGVLLAAVGLSPHGLWVFVILMGPAGVASTIQSPLPYAKAIAAWFDHRRGLALGIAMAGVGLGASVPMAVKVSPTFTRLSAACRRDR
jgi:MFS family permease